MTATDGENEKQMKRKRATKREMARRDARLISALASGFSHPFKLLAERTVELMVSATSGGTNGEPVQRILPFEIYTPENLERCGWSSARRRRQPWLR